MPSWTGVAPSAWEVTLTSLLDITNPRRFNFGAPSQAWATMERYWIIEPSSHRIIIDIVDFARIMLSPIRELLCLRWIFGIVLQLLMAGVILSVKWTIDNANDGYGPWLSWCEVMLRWIDYNCPSPSQIRLGCTTVWVRLDPRRHTCSWRRRIKISLRYWGCYYCWEWW